MISLSSLSLPISPDPAFPRLAGGEAATSFLALTASWGGATPAPVLPVIAGPGMSLPLLPTGDDRLPVVLTSDDPLPVMPTWTPVTAPASSPASRKVDPVLPALRIDKPAELVIDADAEPVAGDPPEEDAADPQDAADAPGEQPVLAVAAPAVLDPTRPAQMDVEVLGQLQPPVSELPPILTIAEPVQAPLPLQDSQLESVTSAVPKPGAPVPVMPAPRPTEPAMLPTAPAAEGLDPAPAPLPQPTSPAGRSSKATPVVPGATIRRATSEPIAPDLPAPGQDRPSAPQPPMRATPDHPILARADVPLSPGAAREDAAPRPVAPAGEPQVPAQPISQGRFAQPVFAMPSLVAAAPPREGKLTADPMLPEAVQAAIAPPLAPTAIRKTAPEMSAPERLDVPQPDPEPAFAPTVSTNRPDQSPVGTGFKDVPQPVSPGAAPIAPLTEAVPPRPDLRPDGVARVSPSAAPVTVAPATAVASPAPAPLKEPVAQGVRSERPEAAIRFTRPADMPVAAPGKPASAAPLPAFRAFAAALFEATREREIPEPVIVGATTVPAALATPQAPLDMTQPRWPQAMVDRIEWLRDQVDAGDTRIRLIPDALGSIDVALRSDGDTVHVHFRAEEAQTRQLLADARPELNQLAEARGLKLGDAATGGRSDTFGSGSQGESARHGAAPSRKPAPSPSAATPDGDASEDRIA